MNFFLRLISSIILLMIVFFSLKFNFFLKLTLILFCLISIKEWINLNENIYLKIFGTIFIIFSFLSIFILRSYENRLGLFFVVFIFLICISSDIGGYIFGKLFGGTKLTTISPNKTYSGVIGAYMFSIILSYVLFFYKSKFNVLFELNYIVIFLLAAMLSTVSQIGDLIISYFKRRSNVKDTGNLIPGHGGLLDRIDGMLFVFPFFLIFLKFFKL